MRQKSLSEIGKEPEPDTGESELTIMSERIQALEKLVGQMVQYQKDHDELHRNMAAAHGKKTVELEKAVAQAITSSQQDLRIGIQVQSEQLQASLDSQRQSMMATLVIIQEAMKDFSGKKISINVPEPSPPVLLDYKIIRGKNNKLLERVREEIQK